TTGQRGLRHLGHGWDFEPGAMLKEYYTIIGSESLPNNTRCRAIKRFPYVSASQALAFQNKGIEQVCTFDLGPSHTPQECAISAASFCDASQPTQYWSTNGQVALDATDLAG